METPTIPDPGPAAPPPEAVSAQPAPAAPTPPPVRVTPPTVRPGRTESQTFWTPRVIWSFVAAATVVVIAAVILLMQNGDGSPAQNPEDAADESSRPSAVEATTRHGDFEWKPIRGAAKYELTVQTLTGTIVFQQSVKDQKLDYPEVVNKTIGDGKLLFWEVVALSDSGDELARSGVQPFGLASGDHPK